MEAGLAAGAVEVLGLLDYIEQVEKLKARPAFSVPGEYFVAHQHEIAPLPEIQFNLGADGDDVWLRIPRLQEIDAPQPDETLKPWVTISRSPDKAPQLQRELIKLEGRREVGREALADRADVQERFDWYTRFLWEPWAVPERARRKTIAQYNRLFSLHQAIASEGSETPLELVWGVGMAAWKKPGFATPLRYPLIVQACEVTLNEKTLDLEVRPRDAEPRLETDCYAEMELPGVKLLESYWKSAMASAANRVNPFDLSTFEGTLKAAVGHLDPTGSFKQLGDDLTPPTPSDRLLITDGWVLFGRKRSGDIFLEDVRRLKAKVQQATALPSVIRSFVEHGDSTVRVKPEQLYRGLSTSEPGTGALELYFPMPYNDEQVSIVQKLHANDGVVVQGPPGTGKTHTIANVISHYLAQGKRVLVTAKGESALAVLQEKLPERIRPLSVALLSDERDGMKQFEHSIQTIAASVSALNPTQAAAAIARAEDSLNQLHAKIAHVDREIGQCASRHMRNVVFRGKDTTPEELARVVVEEEETHGWFDDEPAMESAPRHTDESVAELRQARCKLGEDLVYLGSSLPSPQDFPGWPDVLALHRDLVKANAIETDVQEGNLLDLVDTQLRTFELAQNLLVFLDERKALVAKCQAAPEWLKALQARLVHLKQDDPVLQALVGVCQQVEALEVERRQLLAQALDVPLDCELNADYCEAVGRLISGKGAFALPFGKSEARKLIGATTVEGGKPADAAAWGQVAQLLSWRHRARKALARWSSLSGELALEATPEGLDAGFKSLEQWRSGIEDARSLAFDIDPSVSTRLEEVFGKATADRAKERGEAFLDLARNSLLAHLDKGRLSYATRRVQEILLKLNCHSGAIVEELYDFLAEMLGRPLADEGVLQTTWLALQAELARLTPLKPALDVITRVCNDLESAGAINWARRLRTQPASADTDVQVPTTWRQAWEWREAVMLLDAIDGHDRMRSLFEQRKSLTTTLARTYQELVAEKTWLEVFHNSPSSVRQALQAYLNAVQAMGAGTGVRAIRHRRDARDAMSRAYQAVPCWVLPQWRVSETIPAEVGLFDLVVIDEASQSDIWALPALLRGKKVLVVGDHKQVSPSAVGTAEEKIKELISRFLVKQPHGAQMTPDKSIYDLARVVFAGNSVMLKEHFRCVPAIIEFSNREFYQNDIRPLRVPKANERLDPPLIDVFVKGGSRNKKEVNAPEAQAVVDEIKAILADPQFVGRTIGVVTLQGTAQAAYIHQLVSEHVSPVDVVARRIAVGPPPVFQGRERDIMMISMVLGPGDSAAANRADLHQRFNVALSRARDRMYLFRSVPETQFNEASLSGRVIKHFKQPFHRDLHRVQSLRERCESGFEQDMFDELTNRGFRVEPQVPCGGYRIDFVVEGAEGRRLAIECDGDRFHGPGQWQADMARQRVLERAGWTFWRCFASTFVRKRAEVLGDLLGTLERLGIEPVGAQTTDTTTWVHYKEVDPYGVSQPQSTETTEPEAAAQG